MPNYDSHTLIEHVGRLDDMRYLHDGTAVINFTLAVNSGKKDDPPTWYRVACFRATAENVQQYVKTGDPVMVVGDRLKLSTYTANDGSERTSIELTGQRVVFLKARGDSEQTGQPKEDMPF